MNISFLFPGQGSQHVGMSKDYYNRYKDIYINIFEKAKQSLGFDLKLICFSGPNDRLTATEVAQPAILTASVGVYLLLMEQGIQPNYVAGHSVGQFAALVAAGALTYSDALKIVHKRGQCMRAVKQSGKMVAVVGSKEEQIECIINQSYEAEVDIAGYNSPLQVVFSGAAKNIELFYEQVEQIPGVRAKLLNVSQGFHSRLMKDMEEEFMDYVSKFNISNAKIPVILNCSAKVTKDCTEIMEDIRLQCTNAVLWKQTVQNLVDLKTEKFIEVGASKTLTGFMRSYDHNVPTYSTESVMAMKKMLKKHEKDLLKKDVQKIL
ncbi:ACP S-malonyltransferase [Cerasibacillus sp. JNUCC 74]